MAFAVAVVLADCATPDPITNDLLTASITPGTGRKSVGVISAIGDIFSVQKVGLTVFQNTLDEIPVDAWGIDERVVANVSAQLGKKFEVKRISYSKATFAQIQKSKPLLASSKEDYRNQISEILRGMAASQKCDLYVVVTKGGSSVGNTNQVVTGLGILYGGAGAIFSAFHIYALFEVRVYDGRTFEVLGRQRGLPAQSAFFLVIRGPNREVDKSWWPEQPQSVARDTRIKDATLALVDQSMSATVAELLLKDYNLHRSRSRRDCRLQRADQPQCSERRVRAQAKPSGATQCDHR